MNSCIYISKLFHERLAPRKNSFWYSTYMMYLDLDELVNLEKSQFLFSYNSRNILSFYDDDHFKFAKLKNTETDVIATENIPINYDKYLNKNTKERIQILVQELNLWFEVDKVFILTNLRNFGYVFNPVSFYYCYDKDGVFRVMFSEVNNTFLDQKMYYTLIEDAKWKIFESQQKKNYYISPFISYENNLKWRFDLPWKSFFMAIDSMNWDTIDLKTVLKWERKEITRRSLFWIQIRYPLLTLRVIFLIHYQAIKLFLKKVRYFKKSETDQSIAHIINKTK